MSYFTTPKSIQFLYIHVTTCAPCTIKLFYYLNSLYPCSMHVLINLNQAVIVRYIICSEILLSDVEKSTIVNAYNNIIYIVLIHVTS